MKLCLQIEITNFAVQWKKKKRNKNLAMKTSSEKR